LAVRGMENAATAKSLEKIADERWIQNPGAAEALAAAAVSFESAVQFLTETTRLLLLRKHLYLWPVPHPACAILL
jgi:hypothetical protein